MGHQPAWHKPYGELSSACYINYLKVADTDKYSARGIPG